MDNQGNDDKNISESPAVSAEPKRFMQARAAAALLGVHSVTLIRWAKQGRVPAYAAPAQHKTSWLFDIDEITRVLRENSVQIAQKKRFRLETVPLSREKVAEIVRDLRRKNALAALKK